MARRVVLLEFPDGDLSRCTKDIQAYPRRGYGCERVDLFVPNRLSIGDRDPLSLPVNLHRVLLDMLSCVQPFHCERVVEDDRLVKGKFDRNVVRSDRSGPERVWIAVEGPLEFRRGARVHGHKIVTEAPVQRVSKFFQPLDVSVRQQPAAVGLQFPA